MQKALFTVGLVMISLVAYSQKDTRGYVGVGLGANFLFDDFYEYRPGLHLNFINGGYQLYKGVGINASWNFVGHKLENDGRYEYGILMAGPMYTVSIAEDAQLDFKFRVGYFFERMEFDPIFRSITPGDPAIGSDKRIIKSSRFGWSCGIMFRKNIAPRWLYTASLETYSGEPFHKVELKLLPLSLLTGVAFEF